MVLVKLTNGREFSASQGKSLLEAALIEGVAWPYSCKTGRCNTCKSKVILGETQALQLEVGLTDAEKKENWILGCVRTACTDLLLEVDDLSNIELPIAKTFPSRISQIDRLAPDVIRVILRLPATMDFRFIPGQYINVIGTQGIRRSYSLANSDFTSKTLELHIREVDGGVMSSYWFTQAKVDDLLRLNGPLGTFFLRETANIDLVFLATGTGIAPIKAMIESIRHLSPELRPKSTTVIWGGRRAEDIYFDIQGTMSVDCFVPVLSRASADWTGANGYVQQALLAVKPDLSNTVVYACGSDAMIRSAKGLLIQAGLTSQNFYSDAFVCSANN